jgi:multidrug efflux pump subunit AcrA (membrane-fusion protein)
VLVPASAVVHEGEETAVFVIENETAKRREVKTGIENDERVEIISGVKPGEMVITSGQNGLPDGAKVTLAARDEK